MGRRRIVRHLMVVLGFGVMLAGCGSIQSGHVGTVRKAPQDVAAPEPIRPNGRQAARAIPAASAGPSLLVCASEGGDYAFCPGDTRGGVRLYRQIGRTPCELNQSWGFDSRGVWVDKGCNGEFFLSGFDGGAPAPAQARAPEPVAPPAPAPKPQPAPVPEPAVAAPAPQPAPDSLARFALTGKDQATAACQEYAGIKVRTFGAKTALMDRVLKVRERDNDLYELMAYVRAHYDREVFEDIEDDTGAPPPTVFYIKCMSRGGQVVQFEYVDPL